VAASEEQFLSLEDVAARLQVSDQTVRRWIKSGKLTAYKPGLEYRIREADLEEFLRAREVRPKAPSGSPLEPTLNGLLEEEKQRSAWENAAADAQRFRDSARVRMESLLSAWRESKDREEDASARRRYLDEVGDLLQEAYDAETALVKALSEPHIAEQWPEVQEADRFYVELFRLVQDAGLSIRTDDAQQGEPPHAGQPEVHSVAEPEAA
jgi:excisionase family DNA binding protein